MKTVDQWFAEYGESHQDKFNKVIHFIFVPLIFFSIVGLFASIPTGNLLSGVPLWLAPVANFGGLLILVGLIFYFRLSYSIFIGMVLICAVVAWGNYQIALNATWPLWLISLVIFAVSWVFQFIGHNHEGKKPSFLKDLQFLLVGPAWILGHLYKKLGIKY